MKIQWYPGHMAKSNRLIKENLKYADIVLELTDARIPYSSKDPDSDKYNGRTKNIVVLNKSDLADPEINKQWVRYYKDKGIDAYLVDSVSGNGISSLLDHVVDKARQKELAHKEKGRIHRAVKLMVVGIPNVGKSTFINKVAGKNVALFADRPGVTRHKQWVRINDDFSLLDMPGVLWPKFESETVGHNLAFTGAIKSEVFDIQSLALVFIAKIRKIDADILKNRYSIDHEDNISDLEVYERISLKRGFISKGRSIDYERCAAVIFDEFQAGLLGRITLEKPV